MTRFRLDSPRCSAQSRRGRTDNTAIVTALARSRGRRKSSDGEVDHPMSDTTPRAGLGPRDLGWLTVASLTLVGFFYLTLVIMLNSGVVPGDHIIADTVVSWRTPVATVVATGATTLGSVPVVIFVAVLVAAGLWRGTGRLFLPALLLSAIAATAATVFVVKIAIGRSRPPTATLLGVPLSDFAFPSGHTTDGSVGWVLAAVLAASLVRRSLPRWIVVATGLLVALAIGLSRVYLGYHWPTDVLAGWLLAGCVVAVTIFVRNRLDPSPDTRRHGHVDSRLAA